MDSYTYNFKFLLNFVIRAHASEQSGGTARRWDGETPYSIHPIWCATTLLHETLLSEELRNIGSQTLLLHDIKEDTQEDLPIFLPERVVTLVEEMTFASFDEEMEKIWGRSNEAKLLKLYDKTSNLMDGVWMDNAKWNRYCIFTHQLIDFAGANYGELNIIKIARAIANRR